MWNKLCKTINATKLRKHLATITQLLHFEEKDLEHLSKFMGHTLRTHCNIYRLSDDLYQTAKISKLLLLMMEGGIEQFKGKSLDQILVDIDLSPIVEEEDDVTREIILTEEYGSQHEQPNSKGENGPSTVEPKKPIIIKNKAIRKKWTTEQERILKKHFAQHIVRKIAPKHHEIDELIKHPVQFNDRKWTSIKAAVFNMYMGNWKFSD
nr:unnamed protein product [Callosobruchus analis]